MAVIVAFETPPAASIEALVSLVAADMARVNAAILARTGSEVTMIPEVANHLISSGGKRLRPMLTLAMAHLSGYAGDGHIKLAAAVEFCTRRRCCMTTWSMKASFGAANCRRGCCGAMRQASWSATFCWGRRSG